jgi:hypothetical protein
MQLERVFARVDWDPTAIALGSQPASQPASALSNPVESSPASVFGGFPNRVFHGLDGLTAFRIVSHHPPAQSS